MKFLAILILLISNLAFSYQVDDVESGENLNLFLKRNIKQYKVRYGNDIEAFKKDVIKWNPQVTNWDKLKVGTSLYIDYPYPSYISDSSYIELPKSKLHYSEENQKYSLFGFLTTSFGSYSESTTDQTVKSDQNFPITLGIGSSVTNAEKEHFFTGSIYWAKSSSGKINGLATSNSTISIPGELGFNLYYLYYFKSTLTSVYTGYDFENLNTFNTDQLIQGQTFENISNKLHYATIGVSQSISNGTSMVNTKVSYSNIITSSTNGSKALTGHKYLVYISFRPEGRFSYNLLYKHHDLEGPTKLSINRYGISIGYQFF